ncbi:unnamed protein product [Protopolystoma xenopodis]|uniref:Uncharacterized protein n=1 Tax=Protopolystoma xenopodis TaxID=117903 RepID=A0A448XG07_9PLAT|nr:unnamed protein product [Protopolystoma xenopodis]
MERLTDAADYDSDEISGTVPRSRSKFGNDHAYNALRTRCVPGIGLVNQKDKKRIYEPMREMYIEGPVG